MSASTSYMGIEIVVGTPMIVEFVVHSRFGDLVYDIPLRMGLPDVLDAGALRSTILQSGCMYLVTNKLPPSKAGTSIEWHAVIPDVGRLEGEIDYADAVETYRRILLIFGGSP